MLAFLALSLMVITVDFRGAPGGPIDQARRLSSAVVTPLADAVDATWRPIKGFLTSLSEMTGLREENEQLRAHLQAMEQEIAEARSIVVENRRLAELQGLSAAYPSMERVAARVTGRLPSNYRWAVTIDKGSTHGIKVDMPVIDPDGLVGKVIEVEPDSSTVLLLIDPSAAAKVRVAATTGAVEGNGAGRDLTLSFVDVDASVEANDPVLTAGYDGSVFPPSIPVGTVAAVRTPDGHLEQEIFVRPAVDFDALQLVQVITERRPSRQSRS